MSVFDLMSEKRVDKGFGGIDSPSTTFGDVFDTSMENTIRNFNPISKPLFTFLETAERDKKYRETTGRVLVDDALAEHPDREKLLEARKMGRDDSKVQEAIDQYITRMRAQDPKYEPIKTSGEVLDTVKEKALKAQEAAAKASAGATGMASFGGQLAGGLVAGLADPINLATIPLGAGMASGIIKTALTDAALNVGAEAVSYPFVSQWQQELGQEYGTKDFAENAGIAAVFGGAVGGGLKALHVGLDKMKLSKSVMLSELRERMPDNFEAQEALRHEERRLHIEESSVGEPEVHAKAVEEVDAAINEERPIDPGEMPTDEQVRAMDESKMSDADREAHARIVEDATEVPEIPSDREINPLVDLNEKEPLTLDRQKELEDLHNSPEYKSAEKRSFDEQFDPESETPVDQNTRIFGDTEHSDMSIESLKEDLKADKEFLDIISTCGIGGPK